MKICLNYCCVGGARYKQLYSFVKLRIDSSLDIINIFKEIRLFAEEKDKILFGFSGLSRHVLVKL